MRTNNPAMRADVFAPAEQWSSLSTAGEEAISRPNVMTLQGAVNKTLILLTICTAAAVFVWNKVIPGSVLLSGEMMLRYMGWTEAADLIIAAMDATIGKKIVTYDFARLMDDATEVRTSEFAAAMVDRM